MSARPGCAGVGSVIAAGEPVAGWARGRVVCPPGVHNSSPWDWRGRLSVESYARQGAQLVTRGWSSRSRRPDRTPVRSEGRSGIVHHPVRLRLSIRRDQTRGTPT